MRKHGLIDRCIRSCAKCAGPLQFFFICNVEWYLWAISYSYFTVVSQIILRCLHSLFFIQGLPPNTHLFCNTLMSMLHNRTLALYDTISPKDWSYCPLLRDSTSPFKSTCLFTEWNQAPVALYGPHVHC
jgi:hypothetical protein